MSVILGDTTFGSAVLGGAVLGDATFGDAVLGGAVLGDLVLHASI